jgi:hypothetical protein
VRQFPSWLSHVIGPASLLNAGQATSSSQQRAKHAPCTVSPVEKRSNPLKGIRKVIGWDTSLWCWLL